MTVNDIATLVRRALAEVCTAPVFLFYVVAGRNVAEQHERGGEEVDSGSDVEGQFRGGGDGATSTASPAPRTAARRLHGRRANLHHHGTTVERSAQRLPAIRARTITLLLRTHRLLHTGALILHDTICELFMTALWNRAGHYIFSLWFLSFFLLSFFFSSPNPSGRSGKTDVYTTHGVALVRI